MTVREERAIESRYVLEHELSVGIVYVFKEERKGGGGGGDRGGD